jgi:hypothetical protein
MKIKWKELCKIPGVLMHLGILGGRRLAGEPKSDEPQMHQNL